MSTAFEFLERLRPGGPWVLTAIIPDAKTTLTITAKDAAGVDAFVGKYDGNRNLYYSVNPTRKAMTKKAAKVDIAAIEYLLADLDPKATESPKAAKVRYLAALETYEPAPTAIVDSGNGLQVLWKLTAPIDLGEPVETAAVVDDVEGRIKALMSALGSNAGTQNIDRILRLPGTTNLPNKKKLKDGRVACPTKMIRFNGATCTLDAFPPVTVTAEKTISGIIDIDELPISSRMKNLIRGIHDPKHPYQSRSEAVFAVLIAMAAGGCTDERMEAVFLDPRWDISGHVNDQGKPSEYLTQSIAKARKAATANDPDVAKLNESYALVIIGDKTVIMITSTEVIKFLALSAFNTWLANRFVWRDKDKIPLAKYWVSHKQRRQYEGLVFAPLRDVPGHFNLWRGFAVQPRSGDCRKFLSHLKDNVCRGDEGLYQWVVGWFAQIVQDPDKKMGTSLVLRGPQGTGKTKVGQVIGSLLGEHYLLVADPRYITGRFNSHLVSLLLLHADEGFWAGDHAAEGKLKDLITGDHHFIEYKGKEAFRVRNYLRLLVTGNPDWIVPAGFEERRFAVLDVGERNMQDKPYFAAIDKEMDDGGREALLDHLLKFDLRTVDLRTIPTTAALLDQKLSSLTPEKGWWLDVLTRGELPWGCDKPGSCPAHRLFEHYIKHANKQGVRRRAIETQIGIFLNRHVPGLIKKEGSYAGVGVLINPNVVVPGSKAKVDVFGGTIYTFPPLTDCRAAFAKMMQQDFAWNGLKDWREDSGA
jgi:hypothetical protein